MKRLGGSPARTALGASWRRWVDIVELFALRRPARRVVNAKEYYVLHKDLIEQCGSLAASANEVEAVFYRNLERLAQPWLSPTVLARADREILLNLLVHCRQAEHQLGGRSCTRSWPRSLPRWALPAIVTALVVFSLVSGLVIADRLGFAALERLRDLSDDVWIAAKRTSDVERLAFVSILLLVVSMVAISRTAKS